MRKIILASASPRRRELLAQIGVAFQVIPSEGEEIITEKMPGEIVKELSYQKAKDVAETISKLESKTIDLDGEPREREQLLVIGSDTIVAMGQEILGKPQDEKDAFRMLNMLQENTHSVYTGVTVLADGGKTLVVQFYEETKVTMYPMSEQEIWDYIATKDPMDKAGSYGIQGICAKFIKEISGDYNNVVGLPVGRLYQECKKASIEL